VCGPGCGGLRAEKKHARAPTLARALAATLARRPVQQVVQGLKGGAQCGKMVKGRSKEKADGAGDLAAKMRWLQEQAARRIAGT